MLWNLYRKAVISLSSFNFNFCTCRSVYQPGDRPMVCVCCSCSECIEQIFIFFCHNFFRVSVIASAHVSSPAEEEEQKSFFLLFFPLSLPLASHRIDLSGSRLWITAYFVVLWVGLCNFFFLSFVFSFFRPLFHWFIELHQKVHFLITTNNININGSQSNNIFLIFNFNQYSLSSCQFNGISR